MAEGRFDNPVVAALAGFYDLFRKQELESRFRETDNFHGKTVLITGANSGLGFAMAVEAAKRDARVIMACRRQIPEAGEKVKELSGSDKVEMRYIDLNKIGTIHDFVNNLKKNDIYPDVIILNAASAASRSRKTESGQDELFHVNYFSNFILINLLLVQKVIIPDENKQPRLVFISSDSHRGSSDIDYTEFGRYFKYGVSKAISNYSYFKLVLNTFATELSRRLNMDKTVVQVNCICPGPVNTNIIRETPFIIRILLKAIFFIIFRSPKKAARPVIYLASSDDFTNRTNEYLHMFIPKRMDEKVYDKREGEKLWSESAKLWKQLDDKATLFFP
ncbi:MAG: SDR family NAD(P)-dependent oxidoreductase [Bacteroidales bacterium]|jgi:NAD(P)-dependent dehydrogenase (short-subunit alcohol dehydrogenase family)